MVKFFYGKYNFRPLVGDTDGFNFAANINDIKYVAKGSHWKTTNDGGKELVGIYAALANLTKHIWKVVWV
jgi:hypothetical protein